MNGVAVCGGALYCNQANLCDAFLGLGQSCTSDSACGPTAFCSYDKICTKYGTLGVGKKCLKDSHCADSLFCNDVPIIFFHPLIF